MLESYQGIMRGDRIEWIGDAPKPLAEDQGVRVQVTLLDNVAIPDSERSRKMVAALESLAALNALEEITDPAAWEREVRQDRELPGRDE